MRIEQDLIAPAKTMVFRLHFNQPNFVLLTMDDCALLFVWIKTSLTFLLSCADENMLCYGLGPCRSEVGFIYWLAAALLTGRMPDCAFMFACVRPCASAGVRDTSSPAISYLLTPICWSMRTTWGSIYSSIWHLPGYETFILLSDPQKFTLTDLPCCDINTTQIWYILTVRPFWW